jgi:hypothetical protein
MISSWLKSASLAAAASLAVVAMGTSSADAGSRQLGNSGWTASWSSPDLDLAVDFESNDTVYLEKFVTFRESSFNESGEFIDPVVITFQQTSANAKSFITLNDEIVVNKTGTDWTGFKFTLLSGADQQGQSVVFDVNKSNIGGTDGFTIDPFTNHDYSQGNTILTVGGGIVNAGPVGNNVWEPGSQSGGLVIDANGSDTFVLKEQPLIGGPTPPPIPLPAAAWSGLSGLAGLALVGSRKHLRKLFA